MAPALSLLDVLAEIPDPRSRHGKRHPLPAILSLTVLAMLSGCRGYEAIAQFGREHGMPLAIALGFRRAKTPAPSTFCEIFQALDVTAFEAALTRWIRSRLPEGEELILCLDGKTLRGSKDGEIPGHHLVAAYAPHCQAVLAQLRVDAKTNEHKAALQLLGFLPVKGCIITGDAMFCQRDLCAEIIEKGGDYLFFAKDNQPSLVADIKAGLAFQEQSRQTAAIFSPHRGGAAAVGGVDRMQRRERAWPAGKADDSADAEPDEAVPLEGIETGLRVDPGADAEGQDDRGSGAWHHECVGGTSRRAAFVGVDTRALGD